MIFTLNRTDIYRDDFTIEANKITFSIDTQTVQMENEIIQETELKIFNEYTVERYDYGMTSIYEKE